MVAVGDIWEADIWRLERGRLAGAVEVVEFDVVVVVNAEWVGTDSKERDRSNGGTPPPPPFSVWKREEEDVEGVEDPGDEIT